MQQNPVRWFEIYVQDMARAKKFYESVLSLKLAQLTPPESMSQPNAPKFDLWAFPMEKDKVGSGGALVYMQGFPSGGNSTIIYFGCNDCSVEASKVVKAGGRIEKDKFSIAPYGFIALVYDTEGNMIGLHSME